jgi:hypothetical protein
MRRVLIAFALAALIFGASVVCFLAFEQTLGLGPLFAFWPGFAFQWVLELFGISTTNRIVLWPTLAFWWLAVWLVLRFGWPRSALLSNSAPQPDAREAAHLGQSSQSRAAGRER